MPVRSTAERSRHAVSGLSNDNSVAGPLWTGPPRDGWARLERDRAWWPTLTGVVVVVVVGGPCNNTHLVRRQVFRSRALPLRSSAEHGVMCVNFTTC